MPDAEDATRIDTRLGPIECTIRGEGPALLAIHGAMGGHDQSMLLARALAGDRAGCRVIAVSRPGYLATPLAACGSPEQQADLFAALLDALGIENASVAAVSAGGPSALHFAARHAGRCRALILVSACTAVLETPPRVLSRMNLLAFLARIPGLTGWLRRRVERQPARAAARAIPDPDLRARTIAHPEAGKLLRALQMSVFDRLPDRFPGTINDITQYRTLAPIPFGRIAAPALIVHGEADDIVPFAHGRSAAESIRGAELLALEGAGHLALFTHLDLIRRRSGGFI
jgi:pimeloyl-ACP methyl ester carboxylesterase